MSQDIKREREQDWTATGDPKHLVTDRELIVNVSISEETVRKVAQKMLADLARQLESARRIAARLEEENALLLWLLAEKTWELEQSTKPLSDGDEHPFNLGGGHMADTINGKAAKWEPKVGERVTGMGVGSGIIAELERTGPYHGPYERQWKGRDVAMVGDEEDPTKPFFLVYADSLRPSPLARSQEMDGEGE